MKRPALTPYQRALDGHRLADPDSMRHAMKRILLALAVACLAAPASAQTINNLGAGRRATLDIGAIAAGSISHCASMSGGFHERVLESEATRSRGQIDAAVRA